MNKGYHPAVPPARRQALLDARCTLGTKQAGTGDGVTPIDGDRMQSEVTRFGTIVWTSLLAFAIATFNWVPPSMDGCPQMAGY